MEEHDGIVLADSLWSNNDVVRAWFWNGGPVHSRFPESVKKDAEFGLILASELESSKGHDDDGYDCMICDFRNSTSVELRENKDFMMQVVSLNAILYFAAEAKLRRDVDLAIVAFSSNQDLIGFQFDFMEEDEHYADEVDFNSDVQFLKRVREIARLRVQDQEAFSKFFFLACLQMLQTTQVSQCL